MKPLDNCKTILSKNMPLSFTSHPYLSLLTEEHCTGYYKLENLSINYTLWLISRIDSFELSTVAPFSTFCLMSITRNETEHNIYCAVHDKNTDTEGFCYSVHNSQF